MPSETVQTAFLRMQGRDKNRLPRIFKRATLAGTNSMMNPQPSSLRRR
ncbi:hypothetical protein [Neisseria cinerea]|uniref:Uncharacterized protein n=1 Tax=Neisseria cinerea TaxID=483 RepID=A0A7T3ETY6_NEICI|nr:hypothetical protein [Neisseria cinerea]QPT37285.1 hypothetical protein I6G28_04815 [Neisseria cinerea]SQF83306.1 Uncharacterised protein [Neisseria cinerea]